MEGGALGHARIATSAVFALNGFVLGMWVVNIPEILERTATTKAGLGGLLLLMGGCAWLGMQVSGRLIDVWGARLVTTVSAAAMTLLLLGPGLARSTATLAVAVALLGLANGAVDVGQNAHGVEVERRLGRPVMSGFHAFFSLGGLLAAVAGGSLIAAGVPLTVALSAGAIAGLVAVTAIASGMLPGRTSTAPERPVRPSPWTRHLALVAALAFVLMLAEGVAYDWSTVHLHDELGASKSLAAWAYGAFSVTMTVVRLVADRVVARTGPAAYVRAATLVGALGLTIAAVAPTPVVAIAGWALFGVGLAGCVPQFFTAAGNADPAASGSAIAKVAGTGYVGMLAGPAVIGGLTAWVPLSAAFALPIAGCLAAALLAPRALPGP